MILYGVVSYNQVISRRQSFPHKLNLLLRSQSRLAYNFLYIINVLLLLLCCGYNYPVYDWREVEYYASDKDSLAWCGHSSPVIRISYLPWYRWRFSHHGSIWLRTFLSRTLVASIFNNTWFTRSNGALYCVFKNMVKIGLISKSFSKRVTSCLNSNMLSNTTWRGRRYMHIHFFLNNWITLAGDLYIYSSLPVKYSSRSYISISTILNQTVAGLTIVRKIRLTLFLMTSPHVCYYLIDLLYELSGRHEPNITVSVLLLY